MVGTNGVDLFSLLMWQESGNAGTEEEMVPEMAPLVQVFAQEVRVLCSAAETLLLLFGESVRKLTAGVLGSLEQNDMYTTAQVTGIVTRIEQSVSGRFSRLNYFFAYLGQLKLLIQKDRLRLPANCEELYRVVAGTSAIKKELNEVRQFMQTGLPNLKKEITV